MSFTKDDEEPCKHGRMPECCAVCNMEDFEEEMSARHGARVRGLRGGFIPFEPSIGSFRPGRGRSHILDRHEAQLPPRDRSDYEDE